ncbi:7TM diverse intracellular signaling domain-containing protein [Bernardetia sp. OM2101]|uniref:7TM diverse intracellular signaling domain-containing protein n=1 Tax=Bernardetia sp. OM2101 TaxID=3344876 RepID=UPI0035CE974B
MFITSLLRKKYSLEKSIKKRIYDAVGFSFFIMLFLIIFLLCVPLKVEGYTFHTLGKEVSILEDVERKLTLQDLLGSEVYKFEKNTLEYVNLESSYSAFWLKLPYQSITKGDNRIELGASSLDEVTFYQVNAEGKIIQQVTTGDNYPFSSRSFQVGYFTFPVEDVSESTIYIRIRSLQPLFFSLRSWTAENYLAFVHDFDFAQGIYLGFMILVILYNLLNFLVIRKRVYLIYVFYVFSITFFMASIYGYPFKYLWSEIPELNQFIILQAALMQIFAVIFTKTFFTKSIFPKWLSFLLNFYIFFGFLIILLVFSSFKVEAWMLSQVGILTLGVVLLITGILSYYRGFYPAKYYLLAWGFLTLGFILAIAQTLVLLPPSNYLNPVQLGSVLEVLFISFALQAKKNVLKKEPKVTQQKTLETIRENKKIIREQNTILKHKVGYYQFFLSKETIISFFTRQYPLETSIQKRIWICIVYSLFISFFLLIFQPFGIAHGHRLNVFEVAFGSGLICFIVMFVFQVVLFHFFPKLFQAENWTVAKEFVITIINIGTIGFVNILYANWAGFIDLTIWGLLKFEFYTISVAIFPIFISFYVRNYFELRKILTQEITKLSNNKEQSQNTSVEIFELDRKVEKIDKKLEVSQHIKSEPTLTASLQTKSNIISILTENKEEDFKVEADNLLYIQTADNYLEIFFLENQSISKKLIRNTLKSISEMLENDFPQFFRCHKSYLINLHQVKHISGNAQGYKLHLFYGEELIPVSRKNNSIIKEKLEIFTKKQV